MNILSTDAFAYDYISNLAGETAKSVVYVDFPKTDSFQEINDFYDSLDK